MPLVSAIAIAIARPGISTAPDQFPERSAVPAAEPVQVYPNLLEVRRYEALVRTTLVRSGGYRAKRLPGAGREFSHYREYTPDDDFRNLIWFILNPPQDGHPLTPQIYKQLTGEDQPASPRTAPN